MSWLVKLGLWLLAKSGPWGALAVSAWNWLRQPLSRLVAAVLGFLLLLAVVTLAWTSLRLGWSKQDLAASRAEVRALGTSLRLQNESLDAWQAEADHTLAMAEYSRKRAESALEQARNEARSLLERPKVAGGCPRAWEGLIEALDGVSWGPVAGVQP